MFLIKFIKTFHSYLLKNVRFPQIYCQLYLTKLDKRVDLYKRFFQKIKYFFLVIKCGKHVCRFSDEIQKTIF